MDRVSPELRSKDMKPELAVRRLTHAMGYRYRLHRQDQISPTGDQDVFAFTATSGQRISASVVKVSGCGYIDLTLFDTTGTEATFCHTFSSCVLENVQLASSGTFLLVADGQGNHTGEYSLTLVRLN